MMLIDEFNVKPDVTDKVSYKCNVQICTVAYVHGLDYPRMMPNLFTMQLLKAT